MKKLDNKSIIKAVVFVAFLVAAFFILRNETVQSYLTEENIRGFVDGFGYLGPIVYMLIYAVGTTLLLPGTIFTAIGAIIFGALWGTTYTIIGATIGAASAFFVARTLGHDFAQKITGDALAKYDKKLENHGFATIFYLRMVFFPFNVLNFGAGLTRVKFKDYILATFIGIIPGTFIITFFIATVADVLFEHGLFSSEFLMALISWKVLLAVTLFIASFFIPKLVKKLSKQE